MGELATYNKYKEKIEQIIAKGTNNRKLKIIPSVYEERFILEVFPDNDLKRVCNVLNSLESLFETRKDLTKEDKTQIFKNILKENNMNNKPIFILKDKENKDLIISFYPMLKNTRKNDVFLSYCNIVRNQNHQIKYDDNSMMIGYLTNPGIEDRIKQYMYEVGQEFQKDISPFMIDANNLDELKYMVKDNLFYENYKEPLIALREKGLIMEITKEKGILIFSLYESKNNVNKGNLIITKQIDNVLDLQSIQNIDELKNNCMKIIVEELEDTRIDSEETEEENIL